MKLPDFRDFLASLDADTISGIMRDANISAKIVKDTPIRFESNRPGLQVMSISYQVALGLLAVYHKWLEQSL